MSMELKKYKLGDCVEILDNLRVPLSSVQRKELEKVYPYYGAQGVIDYVDDFIFDGNYILVAEDGNNLKSRNEPVALWASGKFWVNNHAHILGEKNGFDLRYIYYAINNTDIKGYISGSAQPKLNQDNLKKIEILLPTIEAQRSISSILSSIDRKIALNRAINRNLEALAKQLYDYWFVQFDFPNENGRPYKSSGGKMVWNEMLKREIPEGWEVKSVNDVSSICRGVSYKPNDLQASGVLILRGNNIENNHIVYDNNTAYLLPSLISDEQKIKKHDIIITMSSGSKEHIGKCAMFQRDSEHSFGAFLSKITPDKNCPYFLFLYLISQYFKQKIKSICNGTGINNLTNQTFDEVLFAFPEQRVLTEFEKVAQPIFDSIGINEAEITALTRQRDELLPLLMNGQVEVETKKSKI